jgi:hypothetical protein
MKRHVAIAVLIASMVPVVGTAIDAQSGQQARARRYLIMKQSDTVSVEQFTRTPTRLSGDMRVQGHRITYTARLGPRSSMPRMDINVAAKGTDPASGVSITSAGRQSVVRTTAPRDSLVGNFAIDAIPYVNPSIAMLEQVVMRARGAAGARVEVPLLVIGGRAQVVNAVVTRAAADSAIVTLGNTTLRLAVDREGRITGGSNPAQRVTILRLDGAR